MVERKGHIPNLNFSALVPASPADRRRPEARKRAEGEKR